MKKAILTLLFLLPLAAQAQSLSVFDIDTSNFPVMKAKFWAFDENGEQIRNLLNSDFEITEDVEQKDMIRVSCPDQPALQAISSVLTIDISGSITGDIQTLTRKTAETWINLLPSGESECAITAFNSKNYMVQDFTNDKSRLLEKLNSLSQEGSSSFDAGFINPMSGALLAAEKGKNKKVVVFITDGNAVGDEQSIIQKANEVDAQVFCLTIGSDSPEILKNISEQTGGQWFDNINTIEKAEETCYKILHIAQGGEPCEIEWESSLRCDYSRVGLQVSVPALSLLSSNRYFPPESSIAELKFSPMAIYFRDKEPGQTADTTITITAIGSDYVITDIISSSPYFEINPKSFTLPEGESKELTVSYTPADSSYTFVKFAIVNNVCPDKYFYSSGGFSGIPPKEKTLKLTHPNGGEKFLVGSDTVITWEGILPSDKVSLDYSIDNGENWNKITDNAYNLRYRWEDIPKKESDECLISISQARNPIIPEIEWQRCYGGSSEDQVSCITQTDDNGYIFAGFTNSIDGNVSGNHGKFDFWITKIDLIGAIKWQKCLGGSNREYANSIEQTIDGGYIVAGYTYSNDNDISRQNGKDDYWIVKLNGSGDIEWEKSFGGSHEDIATSVALTDDGGFVIAGQSRSNDGDVTENYGWFDIWLVKLSSSGNMVSQRILGGDENDIASSIQQTNDKGFILSGYTYSNNIDVSGSHGWEDYWIVKLNSKFDIQWQKCFGGSEDDKAKKIIQTTDNGYIIIGSTQSPDGDVSNWKSARDFWVVKIDENGEIQWEKCLGGFSNDVASSIIQTSDGGFIILGVSESGFIEGPKNHGGCDFLIIKLSFQGEIEWQKFLGGTESDCPTSIQQTNDGGFILSGYTESDDGDVSGNHGDRDGWIVKLSSEGKIDQSDTSDAVFSIVAPLAEARSIDMGREIVGDMKDSLFVDFIVNTGEYKVRVDSIYFTGADANAFAQVSAFPVYEIDVNKAQSTEFRFIPNRVGLHTAKLNIITQAETLEYDITGIGEERKLELACDILDFGEVKTGSDKIIADTVLIKNISSESINITNVGQLGPDMDQFRIISGGEAFTLAPGEEQEMTLLFKPIYTGRTSGQIGFEYDGTGSPAKVQLFGEGVSQTDIEEDYILTDENCHLRVSPNPSTGILQAKIKLSNPAEIDLIIINSLGEKVSDIYSGYVQEKSANIFKADISNLANGVYYVILKTPNQHFFEKVLVIR